MHVLLVEDDKAISLGLEYSFKSEGFSVSIFENVASATKAIATQQFDIAILDVMLPDGNGYELCGEIKSKHPATPVIFLTACDEEANVVMGLDLGADDYIAKPFRLRELISRMKSVLRRYGSSKNDGVLWQENDVSVNTQTGKVTKGGTEVFLTALEYRLLLTFINNQGQVLSRSQLLESIWDVSGDFVNDNTLTVYIKRLRDKIEDDPQNPVLIKTVRGLGYQL